MENNTNGTDMKEEGKKSTLIDDKLKDYKPEKPLLSRNMVSTEEKGKKYSLQLIPKKECAVYTVDGVVIKDGERCDKLVVVNLSETGKSSCWAEVFVELKGKDIGHAIDQLRASIKKPIFQHSTVSTRRARIVGQSFPRNTGHSVMEKAKIEFKKKYNVDLLGMTSGQIDKL